MGWVCTPFASQLRRQRLYSSHYICFLNFVIISIVFSSILLLRDIPKLFYISSYTISFLSFNFHIVYMYLILSLRESWFNFFCIWLYWDLSYGGLVLVWKEKLWTYLQGLDTQMFNILYLLTYRVECVHDL
jgi:hypothetical protein